MKNKMTIEERLDNITKSSDFKPWSKEDFSESFLDYTRSLLETS